MTAVSTQMEVRNDSLPLAKFESKVCVNWCYTNRPLYNLIPKVELVFRTLISEKSISLYGTQIVAGIVIVLSRETLGLYNFVSGSPDDDVNLGVVCQIIFSYGQSREKVFCLKDQCPSRSKHHEILCFTPGKTSVVAEQMAKEVNNEYDQCSWYTFLIEQPKA